MLTLYVFGYRIHFGSSVGSPRPTTIASMGNGPACCEKGGDSKLGSSDLAIKHYEEASEQLAIIVNDDDFTSKEGKTSHQQGKKSHQQGRKSHQQGQKSKTERE